MFGSTSESVWTSTRFRSSCSEEYAQMINICSLVQEETIEREDPSRASNSVQWSRQTRFGEGLQQTEQMSAHVWVKLDSSKSGGQSRVYEISGDTRKSVNKANKLTQKFVDTCNDEYAKWLRTNRSSFSPDSTADEAAWRRLREPVKKRQQLFRRTLKLGWMHLPWRPQSTLQRWNITRT